MSSDYDSIPPPPARQEQPRDGRNKFMPCRNQRDRDVWAAERWAKNHWTFQQISDALELSHRSNAVSYVERGLRVVGAPTEAAAAEARAIHRARLEAATEVAFEVMSKEHIHVSQGRVVKNDDGDPLLDDGPRLAAADRVRSLSESLRKLDGLDAATKVDTNITVSPQDAELQERLRVARERIAEEERALRDSDGS